jgi:type IV pilus assembly protein PilB
MSLAAGPATRMPSGFERLAGVTAPTSREPRSGFLSDTLVEMGLVDAEDAENAVNESRVRGISPEVLLVQQGQLTDEDLGRARAERAGLDYVDLDVFDRDLQADELMGRAAAERFSALPIAIEGRALVIAVADPLDAPAVAEVASLAQREVIPVVAAAPAIEARIAELPQHSADGEPLPPPEPLRLQAIEGGATPAASSSRGALPDSLAKRIVDRVNSTLDEVARSELVKALDEATIEIEQLSAKLEQSEQHAQALERERDELRRALEDQS